MKVFISWSGERSRVLAEALRDWIPGVIQAARPYFTPDDVAKGSRWSTEIAQELADSSVGIICLTRSNLEAPWIMFEAGALSKNLGKAKVCPLLFGVAATDLKGPLVQFQAAPFRQDEMRRVVSMMNDELGPQALGQSVLDSVFNMWWPRLEQQVATILKNSPDGHADVRSDRDLLEEVLQLSRIAVAERGPTRAVSTRAIDELAHGYFQAVRFATQSVREDHPVMEQLRALFKPVRHIINTRGGPNLHENLRLVDQAAEFLKIIGVEGDAVTSAAV